MYTHKKHKTISKRYAFLIEKYNEDAKQDEKHVPDLLESIMKAPGLVKEEVRHVFSKSVNLDTKSQESRFDPKV